jgi:guanylate kinase
MWNNPLDTCSVFDLMQQSPGQLVVISGPSGSGKTTVLRQVFERCPWLEASVSATTRAPRPGEVHGEDYFFLTKEDFAARRARGEFLECFEVFGRGHWYGTLQSEVAPRLAAGKWVVLEIDVEGTLAVLQTYPDAVTIFLRPETVEELERRLVTRGTESPEAIARRLEVARHELEFIDRYQHQVVNETIEQAVDDICQLLERTREQAAASAAS